MVRVGSCRGVSGAENEREDISTRMPQNLEFGGTATTFCQNRGKFCLNRGGFLSVVLFPFFLGEGSMKVSK